MKVLMALVVLCLSALPAMADVTRVDIQKLLDSKMSDGIIIEYIKTNAPVHMTASDLVALKTGGASDNVLTALAQYMGKSGGAGQIDLQTETVYVYNDYYPYTWYGWYWYPRYPRYYGYYRPGYVYRPVYRPVVVHPAPVRVRGGHR